MPYGSDPTEPLQQARSSPPATPVPDISGPPVAPQIRPRGGASLSLPGLDPALGPVVQRESGGKPFVGYTPPGQPLVDLSNAPLDDTGFPIWDGNVDPSTGKRSHAAGVAQIQPGTWRPIAKDLGIHDFSLESQIKVANELKRREGLTPWAASAGGYGKDPVIGAGNWNVSPKAIEFEQGRRNTSVLWMAPDDYLQMTPELAGKTKSRSLAKSLALGEEIEAIPTLDVKRDGDNYKVTDQDGRKRAVAAKEAGVDLIPVAVHGAEGTAKNIIGMTGKERAFDFQPVPVVKQEQASNRTGMPGLALPASSPSSIPATFPYDAPGIAYGNILPFARNEQTGEIGLAAPEMLRAPVRGMIEGGERAMGAGEQGQNPLRPLSEDEMQAAMAVTPTSVAAGTGARISEALTPRLADRPPIAAPANMMSPQGMEFMRDLRSLTERENAARDIINKRYGQDLRAGGATVPQIASEMAAGASEGQPLVLADVAGENVRGLLGSVAREAGPARNRVKQWAINRLGDIDRDSPLAASIADGIAKYLATGSARTEAMALAEQRAASKPLWDRAMQGGSIAPLRKQLEDAFSSADRAVREAERDITRINQEVNSAAARQSQAGNVYSTSAANRARQFADDKIAEKQKALDQAERDKAETREVMQRAQSDDMANAPGAVWSPYLGRLLKNPKIAEGIRRGWNIERDIADGENRVFNAREYAVVGEDANGNPVIGSVPNMKLLAVAKEGLDAMLDSAAYKDELTGRLNKAGRALKILRDGMVGEVDRLNPAYKTARDAWAGDSSLIANIRDGKNFHKQSPEEIAEHFAGASDSEKKAYRIGAADTLRDDLGKAVFNGDPSKAIINRPRSRQQLLPMFPSPEQATAFLDRVKRARTMFNTPAEVLRGSPTAAREAEDMARSQGLDIAADVIHGYAGAHHPITALNMLARMMRHVAPTDPAVSDTVARLLLDPAVRLNSNPGMELLQKAPLPHVQNMLARSLQRYGRQFQSPGGLR